MILLLQTGIYVVVCIWLIWSGHRAREKDYLLGKEIGYRVGYAQGQLDYAKDLQKKLTGGNSDEQFLKNMKVRLQ